MDGKKANGRYYRVNIVFTVLAFTWLIDSYFFIYLPDQGYALPKVLYPIIILYWLFTGFVYQSVAWMIGTPGPAMIIPLIVSAIYWRILSAWIVGKYDQLNQRSSNAANRTSAMEKAISPNPVSKAIGTALFIIFLLILIWVLLT